MIRRCFYLRKSRADLEAEHRGEGETLARHEKMLWDTLKRKGIDKIDDIFREIVSAETIASRPVMQKLLSQVEQGLWDEVYVVEIERLARGDSIDQGIISQTFKYSNTKIVTPNKTYDPNNEADEEYFEFGLFMSRREYKTINRRMNAGRMASAREGKYVGNIPPYGYERVKLEGEKGYTLRPIPEQAEVVKMIYSWYVSGEEQENGSYNRLGTTLIARKLNSLKIPPMKNTSWAACTIRGILDNPVYMGKIRWGCRSTKKQMVNGSIKLSRPFDDSSAIYTQGLHEPIIDEVLWHKAQKLKTEVPVSPVPFGRKVANPLAGIIVCGICGHKMYRRPYEKREQPPALLCTNISCSNVSSPLHLVESRLMQAISQWVTDFRIEIEMDGKKKDTGNVSFFEKAIVSSQSEIESLLKQQEKIYDFLENGTYTTEVFIHRLEKMHQKINTEKTKLEELQRQLDTEKQKKQRKEYLLPKAEYLLDVYYSLPDAKAKNDLLKEIVDKAVYVKTVNARWHGDADDFSLTLFPKTTDE